MLNGPKSSLSFWMSQRSVVSSVADSAASTLKDFGTAGMPFCEIGAVRGGGVDTGGKPGFGAELIGGGVGDQFPGWGPTGGKLGPFGDIAAPLAAATPGSGAGRGGPASGRAVFASA